MMSKDIRVITTHGIVTMIGLDEDERSTVGRHWNAVKRYVQTGDDTALDPFVAIRVGGRELETRTHALDFHANVGELSFESIYEDPQ